MPRLTRIVSLCALAGVTVPATAQQLEEITVTARKRVETYQDVPVSATAFSSADVERIGIDRPQDYLALTPNATLVQTQNQGTSFITVRGISQARNSEPSVAVMVDGVLMANPSQFNQELFDVLLLQVVHRIKAFMIRVRHHQTVNLLILVVAAPVSPAQSLIDERI